jgi:phosphomannomutase/phosphoglucomutase
MSKLSCFKAYDIRGKVPEDLNEDIAYKVGRAFVEELNAKTVVVGYDIRLESEALSDALKKGITDAGSDVIDIGLSGTEEVYFNTFHQEADGGIMITASHNPKGYNGMKLVAKGSKPISGDSGLKSIEQRVLKADFNLSKQSGRIRESYPKIDYIAHLMTYVDQENLKPLKIVMNAGNGSAACVIKDIANQLPFECVFVHDIADGNFPNGVPNPLLPENRASTSEAVKNHHADFGIAWDGDFDRCFFFDENGEFIEGYYLVGLLAEMLLKKHPGEKIIHDPRLTWNTINQVAQSGGVAIQSKTGHAFIKERMRLENAIYGGEMSAHHYFKDFAYCDSGMIPWLLVAELISTSGKKVSELVSERMLAYPCSGEINYTVSDVPIILDKIMVYYEPKKPVVDMTDGISLEFDNWRMNIRASNTEPLLRLNVESKHDKNLVLQKVAEIEELIKSV